MAQKQISLHLLNSKKEIKRLGREFDRFGNTNRLPKRCFYDMHLALDEILTNILSHGYDDENEHRIDVRIRLLDDLLEAEIVDDSRPFNILEGEDPDVSLSLEDKPTGGLGIYLVKRLMDRVEYHRQNDKNHLILRRNIE